MREIKFRGKRIDNGEWVYGAFVPDALETPDNDLITWGFIRRYNRDIGKMETIEVARESVGQYTGLCDKNGKEIYEGDIVIVGPKEIALDKWTKPSPVIYQAGGYLVSHSDENTWLCAYAGDTQENFPYLFTCEVIGNIHDNPELLETDRIANLSDKVLPTFEVTGAFKKISESKTEVNIGKLAELMVPIVEYYEANQDIIDRVEEWPALTGLTINELDQMELHEVINLIRERTTTPIKAVDK